MFTTFYDNDLFFAIAQQIFGRCYVKKTPQKRPLELTCRKWMMSLADAPSFEWAVKTGILVY